MSIKRILGLCECKGCRLRKAFTAQIDIRSKDGKVHSVYRNLCRKHALELANKGYIKSVTYEETINFEEKPDD